MRQRLPMRNWSQTTSRASNFSKMISLPRLPIVKKKLSLPKAQRPDGK